MLTPTQFKVIKCLQKHHDLRLCEIAKDCSYPLNRVHYALQTLRNRGIVYKQDGEFELSSILYNTKIIDSLYDVFTPHLSYMINEIPTDIANPEQVIYNNLATIIALFSKDLEEIIQTF